MFPLTLLLACRAFSTPLLNNPYTPDFRDATDGKIDSIGNDLNPLPWRNGEGNDILGPQNPSRQRENPDLIRPPSTDQGSLPNMRWSFADSHIRINEGGWTRQTTDKELGTSVELAGVNMRLGAGVIRELHWHKQAEWAYVLNGDVRVTALDPDGGSAIDDLHAGDLWYFPAGYPHSLQGLGPHGTEFLLILDDGDFSDESTFLLNDWLLHTPKAVLGENFHVNPDIFNIPPEDKYIFQGSLPGAIDEERPVNFHPSSLQFTHHMLSQEPQRSSGGEVRITDSQNFPISKTVAAAHVRIQPGALREMHWHPDADEWSYFISGRARVTVFGAEGNARTFDYMAGDVGIVPKGMGHFVENLDNEEEVEMLEIFRADQFRDFSLLQWMGETPRRMVVEHLFDDPVAAEEFLDSIKSGEKDAIRA
ncbi:hypothetical protein ASPZODRAFT_2111113 [Penicilliopsis zonata CBS 506.65]|uniref:Cupin type-1 domain-containing protein n=1 Tax=Penicilliopsis zonata CBS 506.65 TaxID=1073090 RepID=A0A1L9SDG1_9EURO|nr:hypothetical protein ASPZODRAFT_2111113 [Penicilliopsis zonata CBS 506.65]OJJ45178.1 hypothetical protein ASPZODRAFT_2111113 [Penicilliopsis zonata CBS 506.65]